MPEAAPQVPRPRIQGLSDLIFGLALSIGALQFFGNVPADPQTLAANLAEFGFSFLILINVWNRYTATMSVIPAETPGMIRVNMLLLFLVAIEPFLFDVMFVAGFAKDVGVAASAYYGLDIGGMNFIIAYLTHILASEAGNLIPRELMRRYRTTRNFLIVSGFLFTLSALPVFWTLTIGGQPLRLIVWIVTLPAVWVQRILGNRFW